MTEETFSSWKECKKYCEQRSRNQSSIKDRVLFRGQENSCWELKTTLERFLNKKEYPIKEYDKILEKLRTDLKKENLQDPDLIKCIRKSNTIFTDSEKILNLPKTTELMSCFRHYGFPSPLLDWTKKFDNALFFAFLDSRKQSNNDNHSCDHAAIYLYHEYPENRKSTWRSLPSLAGTIWVDTFKSVQRHDLQESGYTMCRRKKTTCTIEKHYKDRSLDLSKTPCYCSHECAFGPRIYSCDELREDPVAVGTPITIGERDGQDVLHKLLIPKTEKTEVHNYFNSKGIDESSLFHSPNDNDESLMKKFAQLYSENNIW